MTGNLIPTSGGGGAFLIVEPEALVRVDLAEAILELCPRARIDSVPSLEDADVVLDGIEELTGAIVGIRVSSLKLSGVSDRVEALGAWIICLNGRRTDYIRAEGWHPLARPFSSDEAQALVRSLLDSEPMAPATGQGILPAP